MKKLILLILISIVYLANDNVFAQNIYIPDVNFKNALIGARVDKNGDGEIQESEALEVEDIYISGGEIWDLTGIEYFKNLKYLTCRYTYISNVDLSNLTELESLDLGENQLLEIDLTGLDKLNHLRLVQNEIRKVDLSHTPNLNIINIEGNPIKSIDLSNQRNIIELFIGYNPELEVIYYKNGVYDDPSDFYYLIDSNPKLKYICVDEFESEAIKEKANSMGRPDIVINSLCATSLGGSYNTLVGSVKLDLDKDGCKESDDTYPYSKVKFSNSVDSGYIIAGMDGDFSIHLEDGTYIFEPEIDYPRYFSATPTNAIFTLPDTVSPAFCITPKGNFNDLSVNIIPVTAARPGFSDAQYKVIFKNQGTTTQSGTVTFNFDENKMNIIGSSPIADQSNNGQLGFGFSNLAPFESRSVFVTMRINSPTDNIPVHVGEELEFSVNITGQPDETPEDNTALLNQKVIGSFDPNDKTCLEGDIITPDKVGKRVNYLIRFENTGTAPAENVLITDYIDTAVFDINTLLVTDASHTCHTQISKGNKVQFIFSDIQLPYTESDKHGFVAFSIQLKNHLQIGDSIKNHADIYFDYNLPVTTNEAVSEIKNRVVTSVKQKISDIQLSVYPNPSKGNFSVELKSNTNAPVVINVIDIKGKIVFAKQYTAQQGLIPIQLEKLAKGTYLVQAQRGNDIVSKKIMIQ